MDAVVVVVWVVWKRLSFFCGGSATRPKIMSTSLTREAQKGRVSTTTIGHCTPTLKRASKTRDSVYGWENQTQNVPFESGENTKGHFASLTNHE